MKKGSIFFVICLIIFLIGCMTISNNEDIVEQPIDTAYQIEETSIVITLTPEITATPQVTVSPTSTPIAIHTPSLAPTPILTPTPTVALTPIYTIKVTPTPTQTPLVTPTPTPTPRVTTIPTTRPIITTAPTPTCTPSPTPQATVKITVTPIPSRDPWLNSYCSMEDLRTKGLSQDVHQSVGTTIMTESIKSVEGVQTLLSRDTAKEMFKKFLESHYMYYRLAQWFTHGYEVNRVRIRPIYYEQYIEFNEWVDYIVTKELHISTLTTKQTAVQEINKYICEHFHYDSSVLNEEAYLNYKSGALVCKDYAVIFQEMCLRCGIECYVEQDWTNYKDGHAYNYLLTDTGKKYYCDATFNDSASKSQGKITKHLFNTSRIIYK